MKGDFTRFTFDPKKHFNRVLMQQGRVILDADWNEQSDIQNYIQETEVIDVVGQSGAPVDLAGFKVIVAPDGQDLILSSGRMYVDGLLCELDDNIISFETVSFLSERQANLPSGNLDEMGFAKGQWIELSVKGNQLIAPQPLRVAEVNAADSILTFSEKINDDLISGAMSSGIFIKIFSNIVVPQSPDLRASQSFLAFLDVWERNITSAQDDEIREKALNGPDTTTRTRIEWRMKLLSCDLESKSCQQAALKLKSLTGEKNSRIAVRLQPCQAQFAKDPCDALSGSAYRGLENQLYRVEIHEPGVAGKATFKWSRNNGAIAFAIASFIAEESGGDESAASGVGAGPEACKKVKLEQIGWDGELRIHKDDWVEILGDETEILGEPGTLARVEEIDETDLILTLTADVSGHREESNPVVRRWDISEGDQEGSPTFAGISTEGSSEDGGWIQIENGIEVCFKAGDYYQTGDYWMVAARNTGEIEWPHDESDFVPKFGIKHHSCLLAILTRNDDRIWKIEKDCRKLFSPLTDMVFLSYVGGDGQEAMPGKQLPAPLQVRVHRGGRPIEGAEVGFAIEKGSGELRLPEGSFSGQRTLTAITGEDGITRCVSKFGADQPEDDPIWIEQVKATLLSPEQEHPPSILFTSNASAASLSYAGGDGQEAIPGEELPAPLQARVFLGGYPLKNAAVRFEITKGSGELRLPEGVFSGQKSLTATTGEDGIARCVSKFGADQPEDDPIWIEQVKATLLSPEQQHPPSILFTSNASAASLSYAGGDGQEAIPGEELPAPLQARVFLGGYPLKNAAVRFEITKGSGELRLPEGAFSGQRILTATTGEDGIARCVSKFGKDRPESDPIWIEQVQAVLVSPEQEHSPSILFSANAIPLVLSYSSGDGQEAMPGKELPAPFMVRVSRGDRPVEGAEIAFVVLKGQGVLTPSGSVFTGKDGIARCVCKFADRLEDLSLRVRAELIDVAYPDETGALSHPSIIFNANASVAEEVAYAPPAECSLLKDVKTVRDAINGLCQQVSFSYVGGDGQEAMPGSELAGRLLVRVSRGSYPVNGASVIFRVDPDKGLLRDSGGSTGSMLTVSTDENGIAVCFCKLYKNASIEARLLQPTPPDQSYIRFNARISTADEVAYAPQTACPQLRDVTTVQGAIDGLCRSISERTSRFVWVHGSSLQVEKTAGEISIVRENYATVVKLTNGSKARMHLSIPTIHSPGGEMPVAQEAFVRLRAVYTAAFAFSIALSVYDGERPISESNTLDISRTWNTINKLLPDIQFSTGLGISIIVECTEGSGQIELSAAGCKILSNW
jgi:hypothetical protein